MAITAEQRDVLWFLAIGFVEGGADLGDDLRAFHVGRLAALISGLSDDDVAMVAQLVVRLSDAPIPSGERVLAAWDVRAQHGARTTHGAAMKALRRPWWPAVHLQGGHVG